MKKLLPFAALGLGGWLLYRWWMGSDTASAVRARARVMTLNPSGEAKYIPPSNGIVTGLTPAELKALQERQMREQEACDRMPGCVRAALPLKGWWR